MVGGGRGVRVRWETPNSSSNKTNFRWKVSPSTKTSSPCRIHPPATWLFSATNTMGVFSSFLLSFFFLSCEAVGGYVKVFRQQQERFFFLFLIISALSFHSEVKWFSSLTLLFLLPFPFLPPTPGHLSPLIGCSVLPSFSRAFLTLNVLVLSL